MVSVEVDISGVAGVPCLLAPPHLAKVALRLLRTAGWHPPHHSRLLLDRRPGGACTSWRAYQLSDTASAALVSASRGGVGLLAAVATAAGSNGNGGLSARGADEEAAAAAAAAQQQLVELIGDDGDGELRWHPTFQLHDYVVDEARCDRPLPLPSTACSRAGGLATIHYLSAHGCCLPEPEPEPVPVQQGDEVATRPKLGAHFSFAELFAGIGGFRVVRALHTPVSSAFSH
jgi:hypothetical protein